MSGWVISLIGWALVFCAAAALALMAGPIVLGRDIRGGDRERM